MITLIIIGVVILYMACTYIFRSYREFGKINSRWYTPFSDMSFSAHEFYTSIENSLKKKGIFVDLTRVTYSEGGIFSSKREYLRISRGEHIFLICAAPFGTDFFISWWGGERISFMKDLVPRIPGVGLFLAAMMTKKSFYRLDTESMFEGTVSKCVMEVIDQITTARGIRGLSDLERQPMRVQNWK